MFIFSCDDIVNEYLHTTNVYVFKRLVNIVVTDVNIGPVVFGAVQAVLVSAFPILVIATLDRRIID